MRIKIIFWLLLLLPVSGYGQNFLVSCQRQNIIYANFPNMLDVIVNGRACHKISLKTNNGKVEKHDCFYMYTPAKAGDAKVDVYVRRKKIGSMHYRVQGMPAPVTNISGKRNGKILKDALIASAAISAYIPDVPACTVPVIENFTVIAMRGDNVLFTQKNEGDQFNDALLAQLQTLQESDKLLFVSINCTQANKAMQAVSIELEIDAEPKIYTAN